MPRIAEIYAEFSARGLGKVNTGIDRFQTKLQKTERVFSSVASGARRLFVASAAALGGAVFAATKFQTQLQMVNTMLALGSDRLLGKFERGLKSLSTEFGESTKTLSKGLFDILSASVAPEKALEVLEVSAKAAIGGMTTTAVAADALTTVLNAYGLSADHATEVSDKLFATVKRGKLTYNELASSIGKAAATASIAGLSLDELLASIATITRAGIRADNAMTSVVGAIRSFLKPTDDGQKLARELGFELNSATLKAIGFTGVMAKINGLSAEQVAVLFPNIRGLKAVAAAMKDLTGFTKDLGLVMNSAGQAQEAFGKLAGTTRFKLNQLKQSAVALFRTIGEELAPAVERMVGFLRKFLNGLNEMPSSMKSAMAGILVLTVALSALVLILGKLVSVAILIKGAMAAFAGAVTLAGVAIIALPILALVAAMAALVLWAKRSVDSIAELEQQSKKTAIGLTKIRDLAEDLFKLKFKAIGTTGFERASLEFDKAKKSVEKLKEMIKALEGVIRDAKKEEDAGARLRRAKANELFTIKIKELRAAERALEQAKKNFKEEEKLELNRQQNEKNTVIIKDAQDKAEKIRIRARLLLLKGVAKEELLADLDFQKEKKALEKRFREIKTATSQEAFNIELNALKGFLSARLRAIIGSIQDEGKAKAKARKEEMASQAKFLRQQIINMASQFLSPLQQIQLKREELGKRIRTQFGEKSPEFKLHARTFDLLEKQEKQRSKGQGAGQFVGLLDIWRNLQAAALKPELQIAKEQLKTQKEIRDGINEIKMKGAGAIVGP